MDGAGHTAHTPTPLQCMMYVSIWLAGWLYREQDRERVHEREKGGRGWREKGEKEEEGVSEGREGSRERKEGRELFPK